MGVELEGMADWRGGREEEEESVIIVSSLPSKGKMEEAPPMDDK